MDKRYKRLKWAQYILFAVSFLVCIVPVAVYALLNCTVIKQTESRVALGGVALFMLAVIALIVFRSYIRKYIQNLPCTLAVLVVVVVMLLFVICLERIIDDVKALLVVESVSAAFALILELASMYCKSAAAETRELYLREKYDGTTVSQNNNSNAQKGVAEVEENV